MSDANYRNVAHRRNQELETLKRIKNRKPLLFETFNSLSNELGLVGRDDPNDPICMTTTRHSYEYFAIFTKYTKQMTKLYSQRKYSQCFDKLLPIILGIKDYMNGFGDTDCPNKGQKILNATTLIWKKLMILNPRLIGIDEQEKIVLFAVMNKIKNEIEQWEYKFRVGSYQRPHNNNNNNNNDDDDDEDDDEDDDDDYRNHNNRNQKRSRKRRLNQEKSDDYNHNKPKHKRQRINLHSNVVADDDDDDDEVEAYEMSELNDLNVKELKNLLKKQHFPVSGTKSKLIERLLYPKKTILEMKKSYHKKFPRRGYFPKGTSRRKINVALMKANQFNPDLYVFTAGKIKRVSIFKRMGLNL